MAIRGESKWNPVMLSTFAPLSVNSAKHLDAHRDRPFAALRACVWITHIVTWSGPVHRSQASLRGAATRGRKTALGGLRCADPPGATMWVIHTLALNEENGVTRRGGPRPLEPGPVSSVDAYQGR